RLRRSERRRTRPRVVSRPARRGGRAPRGQCPTGARARYAPPPLATRDRPVTDARRRGGDGASVDRDALQRLEATVRGRVQGVGFRYFVVREAMELGLVGWVANAADGSVVLVAEGPPAALDALDAD